MTHCANGWHFYFKKRCACISLEMKPPVTVYTTPRRLLRARQASNSADHLTGANPDRGSVWPRTAPPPPPPLPPPLRPGTRTPPNPFPVTDLRTRSGHGHRGDTVISSSSAKSSPRCHSWNADTGQAKLERASLEA